MLGLVLVHGGVDFWQCRGELSQTAPRRGCLQAHNVCSAQNQFMLWRLLAGVPIFNAFRITLRESTRHQVIRAHIQAKACWFICPQIAAILSTVRHPLSRVHSRCHRICDETPQIERCSVPLHTTRFRS